MGKNGGKREGAGRKPVDLNTREVLEAQDEISKIQPYAARVLIAALKATKKEPMIIGRDPKGAPEYEYIEVPDWHIRVTAAGKLLNKRIPDLERKEHTGEGGGPVIVSKDEWDKKA